MAFLESPRFPDEIAFWAVGGVGYKTDVVVVNSGREIRNQTWQFGKGAWDVANAFRAFDSNSNTQYNIRLLRDFYRVSKGQTNGFRFKDFVDFGDDGNGTMLATSSPNVFQLTKGYTSGSATDLRLVQKPVVGTVSVFKNSVLQTSGVNYTLDTTTGLVTWTSTPLVTDVLTWTGQFDVPCRFGGDNMTAGPDPTGALYNWRSVKIEEIRL